jgi:ribose transport system substrate-binding protein
MKRCISLIVLAALFLLNCQRESDGKPAIALVMKTLNNPFFIEMERGANKVADSLGVNLISQAAEREVDVEKQMQIIENLIQRRVLAICVSPSGSREIVPAICKANQAGIPVLAIDTRVDQATLDESGCTVATNIGSDNFQGGRIAGEFIVNSLNSQGKVAILEGIPGHETGDERLSGFHKVVDDVPGIDIVASQPADWERNKGFNVFQNILQAHQDIDAVFACNDMMALGAIEAIKAANLKSEIKVVGFDATKDGRAAIEQGKMTASIAQNPYEMGRLAIINAYKLINGQSIPDYIPVEIELVTD